MKMNDKYILKNPNGETIDVFSSYKDALDFFEENIMNNEIAEDDIRGEYIIIKDTDKSIYFPYYDVRNQPAATYKKAVKIINMLEQIMNRLSIIEQKMSGIVRFRS